MSDKKYLEWLRTQPSCISGEYSEYVNGQGMNPACHVRRANNSGTGYKPKFSAIPLTHKEHGIQHQYGEAALLNTKPIKTMDELHNAKEWFEKKATEYYEKWKCLHS